MRLFFLSCLVFCLGICKGQKDNVGSGRALYFDGVDDLVDLGDTYHDVNLPFSISAWLYIDPSVTYPVPIFVSNDNNPTYRGFWFFISPNRIWCEFGDGLGGANSLYRRGKEAFLPASVTGRWIHVAAVMNAPFDIKLYVNGINVGGSTSGDSFLPMASSFAGDHPKIGYFLSNNVTYRYKGVMDEIRLYDIALTETQVRDGMCTPVSASQPGLIGYWNFNELGGNTIEDISPRAAHGVMLGSPTRVFSGAPIGDISIYDYRSDWTNLTIEMTVGATSFRVGDILNSPQGIHLYRVNSPPSLSFGLDSLLPNSPYVGVFTAALDANNLFTVFGQDGVDVFCRANNRSDNSVGAWSSVYLPAGFQPDRSEYVILPDIYMPLELGDDQVNCTGNPVMLGAGVQSPGATFLWSTGATTSSITATQPDSYWVRVESVCGIHSDTVHIYAPSSIELGQDQILCPDEEVILSLEAQIPGATISWSTGATSPDILVTQAGTYWARTEDDCGIRADTVTFYPPAPLDLGEDQTFCTAFQAELSTGIINPLVSFVWSTGATTPAITVTAAGSYWVHVLNNCAITTDTVHILQPAPPAPFTFGDDQISCEFKPVVLTPYADTVGLHFTWQDGSTSSNFRVKDFGTYSVTVSNECGSTSSSVSYTQLVSELKDPYNVITPNGDSFNEFFVVNTDYPDPIVLKVINRWGQEVFNSLDYKNNWNGSDLASGVYYYTIFGRCLKEARGSITIRR